MKIDAAFVLSAAGAADLPRDGLAELALVGRSNVGKSSLINALVRQRIARTSGAPGKTRLVNLYRVARGGGEPVYLVDLPGYGFARGADAPQEFAAITRMYFGPEGRAELDGPERREGKTRPAAPTRRAFPARPAQRGALLLVDARHPGLANDIAAWRWLGSTVERTAIVATKIDKLSRAERLRAIGTNEAVFEHPVLPVSAVTGEGLDELWKLIDRLLSSNPPPRSSKPPNRTAAADREPRQHPRRKS